jgi:hypothetical protein
MEHNQMRLRRLGLAALVVLAMALMTAACGGDEEKGATLVGRVEGSDAYIALVSDGERVGGYLCDGQGVSHWLAPTAVEYGRAELRSRQGEVLGTATVTDDRASGQVRLGGRTFAFGAVLATGSAGLYRAEAPGRALAGWVVLDDASQRGSVRFIDSEGDLLVEPAPELAGNAKSVTLGPAGSAAVTEVTPSSSETSSNF